MASQKRKTLPSDFSEQLLSRSTDELIALFDTMQIDARTRTKPRKTALAFPACPDELTRWLVEQGLDVDTPNDSGSTPLQDRSGWTYWTLDRNRKDANIDILLDLGANIEGQGEDTPLIRAISGGVRSHVRTLVERGANLEARKSWPDASALELSVWRTTDGPSRTHDEFEITEYLAGLTTRRTGLGSLFRPTKPAFETTEKIRTAVRQYGHRWEVDKARARARYGDRGAKYEEWGAEVHRLCALFDVPLPEPVSIHDGTSPITVTSQTWQAQHNELWDKLVPGGGPAATVQGEVIRISGKVANEILGNGGGNWDNEYRSMLASFVGYLALGKCMDGNTLVEAGYLTELLRDGQCLKEPVTRLEQIAVEWVGLNPTPIPLDPPPYKR